MIDSYKHQGLRNKLVATLREKGISDERILTAIGKIPRHLFLDSTFQEHAYDDKAFPIAAGQTISQPYTVAFQTDLLQVKPKEKVLEIGTGSGYQACVLIELGAIVYSIERQRSLHLDAKKFLQSIGYQPKLFFGDGYKGLPTYAPFDKIIVTAGAESVPIPLAEQLKPNGVMVIPVGDPQKQRMKRITKNPDGTFLVEDFGAFRFVPFLESKVIEK